MSLERLLSSSLNTWFVFVGVRYNNSKNLAVYTWFVFVGVRYNNSKNLAV